MIGIFLKRLQTSQWRAAIRMSAIGIVVALASASPAAAMTGPHPEGGYGPDVSAASFSGGQLHETLAFHNAGQFFAHIVPNPHYTPWNGNGYIGFKTVALGHQSAGPARISFRLGTLTPGRYAVVITPKRQKWGPPPHKFEATWVYLRVDTNGQIIVTKLVHP